jgi:hypothetical protein
LKFGLGLAPAGIRPASPNLRQSRWAGFGVHDGPENAKEEVFSSRPSEQAVRLSDTIAKLQEETQPRARLAAQALDEFGKENIPSYANGRVPRDALEKILGLYLSLPETPLRLSQDDVRLAHDLYRQKTPAEIVEAALLPATVRRLCRDPSLAKLAPIRSLRYFLPVIEEIIASPPPSDYLAYLRYKLDAYAGKILSRCELPLIVGYTACRPLVIFRRFYL